MVSTAQIPPVPLPHEKGMVPQMKFLQSLKVKQYKNFSLFSPFKNSHFPQLFEVLIFGSEFFNIT